MAGTSAMGTSRAGPLEEGSWRQRKTPSAAAKSAPANSVGRLSTGWILRRFPRIEEPLDHGGFTTEDAEVRRVEGTHRLPLRTSASSAVNPLSSSRHRFPFALSQHD